MIRGTIEVDFTKWMRYFAMLLTASGEDFKLCQFYIIRIL